MSVVSLFRFFVWLFAQIGIKMQSDGLIGSYRQKGSCLVCERTGDTVFVPAGAVAEPKPFMVLVVLAVGV
jgi:hypothetical protein